MGGLLDTERATLERFLPGLDARLASVPFDVLESRESPAIELFRAAGGPKLLVPAEHGGLGASPLEGLQIQQALGARAPSLAVGTTMHHFSVASLIGMDAAGTGFEWMLLQGIADGSHLLASGFAEGATGQGVFKPAMTARRSGDDYVINGAKRPCSLAHSMDILTASVEVESDNGGERRFAVAMIAAGLPGMTIEPFWRAPVLAGAQSEAVILADVLVDERLVVEIGTVEDGYLTELQSTGLLWFEVLMTASYLGMAVALVDRVMAEGRGDLSLRTSAAIGLEAVTSSLEGVAARMALGEHDNRVLSRALACRYAAQDAISCAVSCAVEQLGGMAFIGGGEVAYLASASRALGLHPPSRAKALPMLAEGLLGRGLDVV
jgi:alkylation response protein AidB-like acyl-CoA dehydrogenase